MKDTRPQVNIRAALSDIKGWTAAAKRNGLSLSAWLRMIANRTARRELQKEKAK